jgi:holin-like protein
LLEDAWLAIGVALITSTAIAIAVTALTMLGLERLAGRQPDMDQQP